MKIAVIGLGLIGASICKALKEGSPHKILGFDTSADTMSKALKQKVIDQVIYSEGLGEADVTFVCLHPADTIDFVIRNATRFKKDSIVCDVCGVKQKPVDMLDQLLFDDGVIFLGTHPMAGREFSGFDFSDAAIFKGASFILTPTERTPKEAVDLLKDLAQSMGFGKTVITTAEQHDRNIAFTSQLAHLVSNAYVKSPSLKNEQGFSAGSFQDLTRVAKLNEDLWTDLFMMNREPLLLEIDGIISQLECYKTALKKKDADQLKKLLAEGRKLKEESISGNKSKVESATIKGGLASE